ncbi:VRR-NUC domain-containing protein [Janthinobacterium fluminis]|uniref:phosphodiesterase I n=1 Tax=Janthinobacterium fluminis TaxID=2987524 RepID=A0ABT5K0G2_9BURK|nr:VRR-NUC domain-containing protein [Janthinobacterium fluminis]MDC8758339.1 VRR-NUC domain-containing protein [Janthinobacterium fluminis]
MLKVLDNPLYYLDNFHRVLEWIGERYSDLLTDEEAAFIARFPLLPQASRSLFVRMVMRKGCLFRASKLVYTEVGDTHAAALPLLALGWIDNDPLLDLEQLFELLQKPEIVAIFRLSPHEKGARKAEQLEALRSRFPGQLRFSAWYGHAGEHLYHIVSKPLCDRLRLIFFGNSSQDWSEFVLSDLGVYKYEKVEFSPCSRGFRKRRDIDDYLALQRCRERFLDNAAPADVLRELAGSAPDNDWLASRREKLLFQIAQHLEKCQDWDAAFDAYAGCGYPGARVRAIRVLEKSGRDALAFEWLERAWQAPEGEAERQHLLRIAPRLRRKLGHARLAAAPAAAVARLDLSLPPPEAPCHVEGVVRDHLARADAPVYYVENALINSLFGLLCWNAVFKAIPGAFFHPFHRGPADLHSADFQRRRAADFAACLDELDSGQYRRTIFANYAGKCGVQSPFVSWELLDEALLALALDCIPAAHLRKWFERMLLDIKANRSGFPDLIQFWPAERRYRMIEVKGPGDRLQDSQKRWLDYCARHDMPVSVCYLQWHGAGA